MMCKYCDGVYREQNLMIEENPLYGWRQLRVVDFKHKVGIVVTNVNFCPMCGRNLKDGK